ncbi:MAG: hypothetical protein Q9220_002472 [cf. Caloplaca sp. 1 TL-2023]
MVTVDAPVVIVVVPMTTLPPPLLLLSLSGRQRRPVQDEVDPVFAGAFCELEPCESKLVTGNPDPDVADTAEDVVVGRANVAVALEVEAGGGVETGTVGPFGNVVEQPTPLHAEEVAWAKEVDELLARDTVHPVPRFRQRLTHSRSVHVDTGALVELVVVGRGGLVTVKLPLVLLVVLVDGPEIGGKEVLGMSEVLVVITELVVAAGTTLEVVCVSGGEVGDDGKVRDDVVEGFTVNPEARPGDVVLLRETVQPGPLLRQTLTQSRSVQTLVGVAEELVVARLDDPVMVGELWGADVWNVVIPGPAEVDNETPLQLGPTQRLTQARPVQDVDDSGVVLAAREEVPVLPANVVAVRDEGD